ncbi:threonine--tRNA ligase [Candidatus Epulonipiscium fishelsonii]|uniref:Threonine--tRNA ligase n=1 Tax=Candidatus Epulonipiscium fishelsonii TaxID=77094 RepID=A0ACC8X987_9FIRM|nr:threonine--tRNA ligase [Epulopiscium sp. SCG-B11WGA-EpuloA1]ONI38743.1 threonine--tRNA ligase [Epulopiscium sp. SCG-B05WGA-EpuloA1]
MVNIILKDGTKKEYDKGTSVLEVAQNLSSGLARVACAGKIDGELVDLRIPLNDDCNLEILTFEDDGGKWAFRHTGAHILAQAVKNLYPDVKLAIGPAIQTGFYYDFDIDKHFTEEDLANIEDEMKKIVKAKYDIETFTLSKEEALKLMADEPYKIELINDLPEGEIIRFYKQGDFVDLCAGPHLLNTKAFEAFKLLSTAGAYWKGSEKNKMLCRIYGTAFSKKADLKAYLERIEEAKKRDHRKLGKELELFVIMDEGPGFPFFLPKGMLLKNNLIEYWRELHQKAGYKEISTPIILNKELWLTSGHWEHYRENMYTTIIDEMDFAVKPMNCPGCMLVYKSKLHSYKDLPLRMGELGLVHRHELSGALHGLMRVRNFTQDDAHIFMLPNQIKAEIENIMKLIDEVYNAFGFKYRVEISTKPEDSIGEESVWETATQSLIDAMTELGYDYKINEGDGAFYGPKIDFKLEDSLGRTWQCGTIQLDFQLPERFELEYIGSDGEKHRPVMIHRVVFGSIERFIGIITEHFAGAFPTWLAPVAVKVLPISDKYAEYANNVADQLNEKGIRAEIDYRTEKIGYKIREARMERVPYIVVVGLEEQETNTVSVRSRQKGEEGSFPLNEFINRVESEINTRFNYHTNITNEFSK